VYLGYARNDAGTLTKAAGPWSIKVEHPAAAADLPSGFPSQLPLLPGRVVSAEPDGNGWTVDVATDATDALAAAGQLLVHIAGSVSAGSITGPVAAGGLTFGSTGEELSLGGTEVGVKLPDGTRWTVKATESQSGDGQHALHYTITPDYTPQDDGR
jgi:hypothetical protein